MAKDVDQALKDITAKEGGMDEDSAAAYVKAMQKEKRYLRDVY
jgi:sulfite reductase alpha subunit-like flavoprotein